MERRDERSLIQLWQEAVTDLNQAQERADAAFRASTDARNILASAKKAEEAAWGALCSYRDAQLE